MAGLRRDLLTGGAPGDRTLALIIQLGQTFSRLRKARDDRERKREQDELDRIQAEIKADSDAKAEGRAAAKETRDATTFAQGQEDRALKADQSLIRAGGLPPNLTPTGALQAAEGLDLTDPKNRSVLEGLERTAPALRSERAAAPAARAKAQGLAQAAQQTGVIPGGLSGAVAAQQVGARTDDIIRNQGRPLAALEGTLKAARGTVGRAEQQDISAVKEQQASQASAESKQIVDDIARQIAEGVSVESQVEEQQQALKASLAKSAMTLMEKRVFDAVGFDARVKAEEVERDTALARLDAARQDVLNKEATGEALTDVKQGKTNRGLFREELGQYRIAVNRPLSGFETAALEKWVETGVAADPLMKMLVMEHQSLYATPRELTRLARAYFPGDETASETMVTELLSATSQPGLTEGDRVSLRAEARRKFFGETGADQEAKVKAEAFLASLGIDEESAPGLTSQVLMEMDTTGSIAQSTFQLAQEMSPRGQEVRQLEQQIASASPEEMPELTSKLRQLSFDFGKSVSNIEGLVRLSTPDEDRQKAERDDLKFQLMETRKVEQLVARNLMASPVGQKLVRQSTNSAELAAGLEREGQSPLMTALLLGGAQDDAVAFALKDDLAGIINGMAPEERTEARTLLSTAYRDALATGPAAETLVDLRRRVKAGLGDDMFDVNFGMPGLEGNGRGLEDNSARIDTTIVNPAEVAQEEKARIASINKKGREYTASVTNPEVTVKTIEADFQAFTQALEKEIGGRQLTADEAAAVQKLKKDKDAAVEQIKAKVSQDVPSLPAPSESAAIFAALEQDTSMDFAEKESVRQFLRSNFQAAV